MAEAQTLQGPHCQRDVAPVLGGRSDAADLAADALTRSLNFIA